MRNTVKSYSVGSMPKACVHQRPIMVAHVHGRKHRQQEKAYPQLVVAAQQLRIGAHDERERLAMPELIVAPALEPAKYRVKALAPDASQGAGRS